MMSQKGMENASTQPAILNKDTKVAVRDAPAAYTLNQRPHHVERLRKKSKVADANREDYTARAKGLFNAGRLRHD
jgi:hypothetical protein